VIIPSWADRDSTRDSETGCSAGSTGTDEDTPRKLEDSFGDGNWLRHLIGKLFQSHLIVRSCHRVLHRGRCLERVIQLLARGPTVLTVLNGSPVVTVYKMCPVVSIAGRTPIVPVARSISDSVD
jgi:hypothetical protein